MTIDRRRFIQSASSAAFAGSGITSTTQASQAVVAKSRQTARLPKGGVSSFVKVNGIRLHYVKAGTGPVVVLLHGWPQTWFAWRHTMERLSHRFTVIAPDLRGTGLSERPMTGYDKQTIATDIRDLIAAVAGPRAHVVAHDMGGKAAYVLAHLYPSLIDRLVLVDCLIPGTEVTDALQGGAWHYGFHMAPKIPEMLTKGRERDYITAQIRNWSYRKDAIDDEAITEFTTHYASAGGMTAGFNFYRALREDVVLVRSFEGKTIDMPVMAIGGRYGVGTKLADALRKSASNLTAIIAEDSGHFVAEEAPDFFCQKVERFLTS